MMHKDLWKPFLAVGLVWWFATPAETRAQGVSAAIVDYNIERQLMPGAIITPQQDPFSHRYGYYSGPVIGFTIGRCASKWEYLDYIDRVERAEKFGYCIPAPPPGWVPVWSQPRR